MSNLGKFKKVLHLLLLTVFITYSCLYSINFVNKFQPQPIRQPPPASAAFLAEVSRIISQEGGIADLKDVIEKNSLFADAVNGEEAVNEQEKIVGRVRVGNVGTNRLTDSENEPVLDAISSKGALKDNGRSSSEGEAAEIKAEMWEEDGTFAGSQPEAKSDRPTSSWPITLEHSNASTLYEIDFDRYAPEDREFLKSRTKVFEKRAALIGEVCKRQNQDLHEPSGANHLVWDTKHKPPIVWCPNYKVASTSMMMSFLRISSKKKKLEKSKKFIKQSDVRVLYWRPNTSEEKARFLKDSVRVVIVRHPFTRILSAYRDKMRKKEPGPKKFHFRKLQKQIIAKYRKKSSTSSVPSSGGADSSSFPTFPEFVQYVIDETRSLTSTSDWKEKVRCWVSYWAHCNVCSTDYTVVMKLETMDEDKRFLITLSGLEELKEKSPQDWRHLHNSTSHDLAPEFYSQLTKDQILQLYESYRLDFELFDYNIDDYLALV